RPHAVEHRGHDARVALRRVLIGDIAHVLRDAEDLLDDHQGAARLSGRLRLVSTEAMAVGGRQLDGFCHGILRRGRQFARRQSRWLSALTDGAVRRSEYGPGAWTTRWSMAPKRLRPCGSNISMRTRSPKCKNGVVGWPPASCSSVRFSATQLEPWV